MFRNQFENSWESRTPQEQKLICTRLAGDYFNAFKGLDDRVKTFLHLHVQQNPPKQFDDKDPTVYDFITIEKGKILSEEDSEFSQNSENFEDLEEKDDIEIVEFLEEDSDIEVIENAEFEKNYERTKIYILGSETESSDSEPDEEEVDHLGNLVDFVSGAESAIWMEDLDDDDYNAGKVLDENGEPSWPFDAILGHKQMQKPADRKKLIYLQIEWSGTQWEFFFRFCVFFSMKNSPFAETKKKIPNMNHHGNHWKIFHLKVVWNIFFHWDLILMEIHLDNQIHQNIINNQNHFNKIHNHHHQNQHLHNNKNRLYKQQLFNH